MKVLGPWLLLIWGILASAFGGYSLYATDSLDLAGARHEASHAVFESNPQDEAVEILQILDAAWFRGNQSSLILLVTGLLLAGSSFAALRRNKNHVGGSVS